MKNLRISKINLFIVLLINVSTYTQPGENNLLHLAKVIVNAPRRATRNEARTKLLQGLKENHVTDAGVLSTVINAYHHKKDTLLYPEHAQTLHEAVNFFSKRPGFSKKISELLSHANDESFIKGHMYELETALKLEKRGEKITHFGYSFYCPIAKQERTIDLATQSRLIECKSIYWTAYNDKYPQSTLKIQEQLMSYKFLSLGNDALPFVLQSKKPINPDWKKWLDDNEIKYEEDN